MERYWTELWWLLCRDLPLEAVSIRPRDNSAMTSDRIAYSDHSPEGLREVFTTGGLPPLVDEPDPVYKLTYGKEEKSNR